MTTHETVCLETAHSDTWPLKSGRQRTTKHLIPVSVVALLFASAPATAAVIQVGSISWEAVDASEPDYLFCFDDPCARVTVTNDLGLLSAAELASLNLNGDEDFENAVLDEANEFLGNISPGGSAFATLLWPFSTLTLIMTFPANLTGTPFIPVLTGPTLNGAAAIEVTTVSAIPEPASLSLLGLGLGLTAAWVRRRTARRP